MRALVVLALLPLTGCPVGGDECATDRDCAVGTVCANTHDCLSPGEVHRVAVRWTVLGNPADATTCAPIPNLDLAVFDDQSDDQRSWAPVPCATGQFVLDKLPTHFDRVLLRVVSGGETVMANIPAGGGDVLLDLTTGAPPADAGVPDAAPLPDAGVPDAGAPDAGP